MTNQEYGMGEKVVVKITKHKGTVKDIVRNRSGRNTQYFVDCDYFAEWFTARDLEKIS